MSKNLYDSLSTDIQQALMEAAAEAGDYERQLSRKFDEDSLEQIKEKGMTILEVDKPAFKKAVQPVYDKYSQYAEFIERINAMDPTK